MKTKQKAITPIVATILLVVVSVVLLTIVLNWGRDFSNKSLATVNTEKLSKSNASEFVYTKAFSDGVIQFNYAPPANLKDQDIIITGYKIFFDNNETTEISFTSNHTLSQGLNIIPLTSFSDQNITSRKMDIQLQTSDGKYITLNSVTNNEPYAPSIEVLATADLTNLVLSGSPANYTFSGSTYTYNGITVLSGVSSITVTPTGAGTITVEGSVVVSGQASSSIALTSGVEKTITVIATESEKTPKTYVIKVTRAAAQSYNTGAFSPGTVVSDASVGTQMWSNPDNSKTSDNSYASAKMGVNNMGDMWGYTTHYLKATNFGFNIPVGATIDGIKIEIEKHTNGAYETWELKIVKADGSIGTTNKGGVAAWPSPADPNSYETYGDLNDLWGETWTAEQINDSDFGVVISITGHTLCLNEDTLILTDSGYIKIKNLNVGDLVYSYNEITNQLELKSIVNVWSNPISVANNRYFYIYYNNGQLIKATENHKFYVDGNYLRADELKIGNKLLSSDFEEYLIENIEVVENTTDYVWDITVADNHNFFANDVLVHNFDFYAFVDHIRMTVYYTN